MTSPPRPAPPSVNQPTWEQPAPPPPGPPVRPHLRRSGTEMMIGGVCGGLAESSSIDPLLWRVGVVALALAGPGVIVYVLLWMLMPSGPDVRTDPLNRLVERLHTGLVGAPPVRD